MFEHLRTYGRFATGLRGFLRRRMTLQDAREIVRRRLQNRPERFLRIVERGIYGNPGSPYLALLREAGCEYGDLCSMVRREGLHETLISLREAGVYVTFEEFKGRDAIVRNGRRIRTGPRAFDNPYLVRHYVSESGGSTGRATRIPHDLDHILATMPYDVLSHHALGVAGVPTALWRAVLPSCLGVHGVLRSIVHGNPVERWFTPTGSGDTRPAPRFRAATAFVVWACRLQGAPVPRPEYVPLDGAAVVARWAAERAAAAGGSLVRTSVSSALRIATAALEDGVGLEGVTFMGAGEPPTPAKVSGIERTGATYSPNYAFTEAGLVGRGCARPVDRSDVHLLEDALALVQYRQRVPGWEREVDAFCFTSLLPSAPCILLNVEVDDYGIVESRSCGCLLGEAGFGVHLRQIRSYRKLTGEGVTLVGGDVERILEEVLPARLGGHPHHFQLQEREDAEGFTRLVLVVHPQVDLTDEREVVETVYQALARAGAMEDHARAVWSQAGSIRVERSEPRWSRRGKLHPLLVDRG